MRTIASGVGVHGRSGVALGERRIPVAVLGATGIVGQHLVRLLADHPWFRLAELTASDARVGRPYGDVVDWVVSPEPPPDAAHLLIKGVGPDIESPIALSALPGAVARDIERDLARSGRLVSSNASVHRMEDTTPLVVPEVNAAQLRVAERQPWRDRAGVLVCNPNCVATGLAIALAPIQRRWGIEEGALVTLQALSGAGLEGPTGLSSNGNVVPWIEGEEEKIPAELGKLLGCPISLAVTVNRVPVVDGHCAHLFLRLKRPASPEAVGAAIGAFASEAALPKLPSLPSDPVVVVTGRDRPQPRLDAMRGNGMTVSVGRLRVAPPFDLALTVVSHNAIRGAAGACLANAELCLATGLFQNCAEGKRTPPPLSPLRIPP